MDRVWKAAVNLAEHQARGFFYTFAGSARLTMNKHPAQLKKHLTVFHISTGTLALLGVLFHLFITPAYPLFYQILLGCYVLSGSLILALYFKTLDNFQRWYLELVFIAPILIITFLLVTHLFDHLLFG